MLCFRICAEIEQRKIDRFFGIPTEEHRLWLLAEKKRIAYEKEVEAKRLYLLKVGIHQPTHEEALLLKNSLNSTTFEKSIFL